MKHFITMTTLSIAALTSSCGHKGGAPSTSTPQEWTQPDPAFRAGRGYDVDAEDAIRGDCLLNADNLLTEAWVDAQGIKANLTETRVTSHEQLVKEMRYDVSASARYTFYSGNVNYSRYDKFASSGDSFTWVFNIQAEIGTKTLKTEQITLDSLKPDAKALVLASRSGDASAKAKFFSMCGKKFVRSVRLGGHISSVLEVSAKAVDVLQKISADIEASGGSALWKASGSAHFNSFMQEAQQRSMLTREFSQAGGAKIHYDLSPDSVQTTLDDFASSLTHQNATVIGVELVSWDTALNLDAATIVDQARAVKLQELLHQLWAARTIMDKIDTYLYLFENNSVDLAPDQVATLRTAHTDADRLVSVIIAEGGACYQDGTKCNVTITPVAVQFPPLNYKNQLGKNVILSKWSFNYPDANATFQSSTLGDSTLWGTDNALLSTLAGGEQVWLRTELFEKSCNSITDVLSSSGPEVLTSDLGEKLNWAERTTNASPGTVNSVITFGYKGSDGRCLLLQVYTDKPATHSLTLADNSQAAKVVRRIAQTVHMK